MVYANLVVLHAGTDGGLVVHQEWHEGLSSFQRACDWMNLTIGEHEDRWDGGCEFFALLSSTPVANDHLGVEARERIAWHRGRLDAGIPLDIAP